MNVVAQSLKLRHRPEVRRVGKFGLVGILNTFIDFCLYNLFSTLGLSLVQSNLLSTTVAMSFSFVSNKKLVFKKHSGSIMQQAVIFLVVTAFGLYVLQTGTIVLLTDVWLWPMHTLIKLTHAVGIMGYDEFLIKNGAKALATGISLTWNYLMYKKVVFR
jgi:putative flippase GtrA